MEIETVPVKEVAKRLGITAETVQAALRDRTFPVGFAIRCKGGRYRYIIPRKAFENLMAGMLQNGTEAV